MRPKKSIYEIVSPLGLGDNHFNSMRGLFFAPYTFSCPSGELLRAPKGKIRDLVRITYSDTTLRAACGNSGLQRCKVEP